MFLEVSMCGKNICIYFCKIIIYIILILEIVKLMRMKSILESFLFLV